MSTLAWILILVGGLIARQVSKGRVMDIGTDLSDAFLAIARGDAAGLTAVLARTDDSSTPAVATLTASQTSTVSQSSGFAHTAQALGAKAKGYKWTAVGPDYYDCSGLMYATAKALGYKGVRFTTFTIGAHKEFQRIGSPATEGPGVGGKSVGAGVNDLVVWPTHHMGVIVGPDEFYSARSKESGIGTSKISTFRSDTPVYYRYVG